MKHLLSGVALAALLTAGVPALAQTSSDKQSGDGSDGCHDIDAGRHRQRAERRQHGRDRERVERPGQEFAGADRHQCAVGHGGDRRQHVDGCRTDNAQSGAAATDNATSGTSTPSDSTGKPGKHMKSGAAAKHRAVRQRQHGRGAQPPGVAACAERRRPDERQQPIASTGCRHQPVAGARQRHRYE